jgi:hypothetical protein
MKIKAFLAALLVAGVATSAALAEERPGKGSKEQQALGCRPVVSLILKGEYVSGSTGSFAMLVKQSNRHARALKNEQVTVTTDERTRRVRVQARARRGGRGGARVPGPEGRRSAEEARPHGPPRASRTGSSRGRRAPRRPGALPFLAAIAILRA